ncbi:MAG TPA: DnaJ C-terminal domain-containing protein, partial [Mobilitalea sp.]|nr:DnaJ C-terminal domain-containing protein [Mobilitalea sp.]
YDIFSTAPISYATATLGGDVKISTVDGDVIYNVKPGTQTDTKVRLREKGVPTLRNKSVRGDHYVTLVVQIPTGLNSEQKELLKKFDEAMTGKRDENPDNDSDKDKSKKKFWK